MSLSSEIKSKLNIVDMVREDGIQLKPEGVGRWSAKCPFHNEKTPSFKIDESFQNFKCFGCGESGDTIAYYAKQNALDYKAAMLILAEKLGIEVDKSKADNYDRQKRLLDLVADLEKFFISKFNELPNNHPAKLEITSRNLQIEDNMFGFAPNDNTSIYNYLISKKYTEDEMKEVGILNEKGNIQQRNRLIFFIKNYMGVTTGFSGRTLEKNVEGFKYVNSKSSIIFDKQLSLYGIERAKKKAFSEKYIYLVEGQFDVIAMYQNGYENTVAISGTAFGDKHISVINKCITDEGKIILCLDGDSAGLKAMLKIFQNNPSIQDRLYCLYLPKGMDPCDYFLSYKGSKLPEYTLTIKLLFDKLKSKYPLNVLENRTEFVNQVQNHITQYIKNKSLKETYLKEACNLAGVSYQSLEIKTANTYTKKEEKEKVITPFDKLSKEDKLYLTALSFYIVHKNKIEINLLAKDYPKKYSKIISEIKTKFKNVFIPEDYEQSKIAYIISEIYVEKLDKPELINSHYKVLLSLAKKETEDIKRKEKQVEILNVLSGLSGAEFLNALSKIEEQSL